MKTVLRTIAAVVAGLVVLFVLVVAVEAFSNVVHPFPSDFGGTQEEICQHVERYPSWFLAVVVPMWGFAGLAATGVARWIGNVYSWGFVGVLLLAALVCNLMMLPYPLWFKVSNLLVMPLAIVAGGWLAGRRPASAIATDVD